MAILRDVLARLSVDVDIRPLTDADRKIEKLKGQLRRTAVISTAVFSSMAYASWRFVEAASAADEVVNGLDATFKGSSASVKQWSRTTAKELGRSEYALQSYALRFGAFLTPVFEGTDKNVTDMSETLTRLALDLASFYDTSEEEAMMRLFSGMSGETEAVRRLGIDISDTSLEEFNRTANGDARTMRALNLAEKSALRFKKILEDTKDKQGDILRSQGRWADTLKRVQSRFQDIAVAMGKKLMPLATKLLKGFEDLVVKGAAALDTLLHHTSALEAAFTTLEVVAGYAAAAVAVIAAPAVISGIAATMTSLSAIGALDVKYAAIALAFMTIEDVITGLRGGDSYFRDLLQDISGLEEPSGAVAEMWKGIKTDLSDSLKIVKEMGRWLYNVAKIIDVVANPSAVWDVMKNGPDAQVYKDVGKLSEGLGFDAKTEGGGFLNTLFYGGSRQMSYRSAGETDYEAAVAREDQKGAIEALMYNGMGAAEAYEKYNKDRTVGLSQGLYQATDRDVVAGRDLVQPSVSAPYSGDYSAVQSGGGAPVINMAVYPSSGLDEKQVADIASQQIMSEVQRLYSGGAEEAYSSPDGE